MTTSNHTLIKRVTLNATASSITLSSIPQTGYTDLKLVVSARSNRAALPDDIDITFNGVSSGYTQKELYGDGGNATSINYAPTAGVMPGANATANTFSNVEIYIPNYTSDQKYKAYSSDSVMGHNSSESYQVLAAGLWSNASPITSITLTSHTSSSFVAGSSVSLYGIADVNTTPSNTPKASGGDIVTNDGTYWYHAFTSTGVFTPSTALSCDYLVVAGGGGGGYESAGGGGAGGAITATAQAFNSQSYTVSVGAGGSYSANGSSSRLADGTLVVGGGTGGVGGGAGNSGGSGGGGGGYNGAGVGGAGTAGQGYAGGVGRPENGTGTEAGGGGGGAGGIGGAFTGRSWDGGIGLTSSLLNAMGSATSTGQAVSTNYYYAGGGGGYNGNNGDSAYSQGVGGYGGGGKGYKAQGAVATAGSANTGGGGGGGWWVGGVPSSYGQPGGSGIVIIRYAMA